MNETPASEVRGMANGDTRRRTTRTRGYVAVMSAFIAGALLAGAGAVLAAQSFSDVPESNPFFEDIEWMAQHGVSEGYPDGTYRPSAPVTRGAMSAFMRRLIGEIEVVTSEFTPNAGPRWVLSAPCPSDKRAIGGGGASSHAKVVISQSMRFGDAWVVTFATHDGTSVTPGTIVVNAVCVPDL